MIEPEVNLARSPDLAVTVLLQQQTVGPLANLSVAECLNPSWTKESSVAYLTLSVL